MVDAAESALAFVDGRSRSDLDSDLMLLMALTRALEVVGEAAARVTPETRQQLANIPWHDVVAMRNRLVHGYFDVDHSVVWATVQEDLRPLIASLRSWLAKQ